MMGDNRCEKAANGRSRTRPLVCDALVLGPIEEARDQTDHEEYQEDVEQNLSDTGGSASESAETEDTGYNSDNKEDERVA